DPRPEPRAAPVARRSRLARRQRAPGPLPGGGDRRAAAARHRRRPPRPRLGPRRGDRRGRDRQRRLVRAGAGPVVQRGQLRPDHRHRPARAHAVGGPTV
ncbi:MAG: hypothetical protein AVDCRST_MAG66-4010, partial [uncultured Pseudonocardia sp.]